MENTNLEQNTQAENMGNETEVQGPSTSGKAKTFTQEEVNGFVQSRMSRLKGQIEKSVRAEYDQKLADLHSREMKLLTKEKLEERGMDKGLADILTCTDEEDLENKLDALQKIYSGNPTEKKQEVNSGFRQIGVGNQNNYNSADPVRKAMGLDRKD